ncbi:MAG TPA: sensor histidine kinase [Leptospiraceae bacterium]|nr:sensor histidine kinase [Leptospiraceae bacterium]HMY65038.1 sensor histidine kinase [Leptospiraceae bacterium]HMZ58535.1 sensor histidine kinase [Leptospiraceae bacterium]HNF22861.1 sensor histidine kinase [Leptospiraceae bacterium]HNI95620.1 sensor histidine kinase [Leptospiraceae bacterium]
MKSIYIFLIIIFNFSLSGYEEFSVNDSEISAPLGKYSYFLEDGSKSFNLDQVRKLPEEIWKKNNADTLNLSFSDKAFWICIKIHNGGKKRGTYFIELNSSRIDYIEFYSQHSNYEKERSGILVKFSERKVRHKNPVFTVSLLPESHNLLYFRIESGTVMQFNPVIHTEGRLTEKTSKEELLNGIMFGIIILSCMYGLLLYLIINDLANLYFAIYSAVIFCFFLVLTGTGFHYIWPNFPIVNHTNVFFGSLGNIFGLMFQYYIMDFRKNLPKLEILSKTLITLNILTAVMFSFIPFSASVQILVIETVINSFFFLVLGFLVFLKNYNPGVYIIIALFLWVSEWIFRGLNYFSISSYVLNFNDTVVIRCIERIILCLALTAKVRIIKEENEKNQTQKLSDEIQNKEKLRQINADMEKQVKERTYELQREKETAVKANLLKDTFITAVTHDLKSPILNTRHILEIMISKEEMDWEERLYYLKTSHHSLTASYQMIYNILNMDRFNSGRAEIHHEYVDLDSLIQKVIQGFEYTLAFKNITLEYLPREEKIVIGDFQLLLQLFSNLISNAVKFSFEKSTVSVSIENIQNFYSIRIKDSGTGMSPEQIKSLSFRFNPVKEGTAGEKGSGLGISIVRQILELHEGSMNIESSLNTGTEISIYLPCQEKVLTVFSEDDSLYNDIDCIKAADEIRILKVYDMNNLEECISRIVPDFIVLGLKNPNSQLMRIIKKIAEREEQPADIFLKIFFERNVIQGKIDSPALNRLFLNDIYADTVKALTEFLEQKKSR